MAASRTIFALVLAVGFAFALGCGSKPDPTQPNTPENPAPAAPSPTPPDPNTGTPKVELPKVVHELDQAKHVIPAGPVRGTIAGVEVTPEARIQGAELTFHLTKAGAPAESRSIKLNLEPMLVVGQPVPPVQGREWKIKFETEAGPNVPHVWMEVPGKDAFFSPSNYALTLQLGQRKDGKVPGKIYLSLLDESKTVLAGTFEASYVRSNAERPGSDDTPYIGGDVTFAGVMPETEVRVGYAAFTTDGVFFRQLSLAFDPPAAAQVATRIETSLIARSERKGEPFRYEHVKLAPGRYLLWAGVVGGPVVWKWVDLPAGGPLTENFAFDAAKTGVVEVSVPANVTGKILIAPAEQPGKPVMDAELFRELAGQTLQRDVDIAAGKAVVKNLGPGKYEVRVGELRGNVEVVAGKTAELVLTPPKQP